MSKILIIEDSVLLLDLITELLTINDFWAVTAITYEEGYDLLQVEEPDLILCNYPAINFPRLNVFSKICSEVARQNIPLLFMFPYQPVSIKEFPIFQEQQDFLVKPFSSIILIEKIQALLKMPPRLKINF
ncbi:hypothetical protein [Nostoc sp. FACHB-110]|uniref:hypothetical protein n=1 Tax=Nostoc sp. FACHB-110 TaxID=2692834 RepID=UPI0016821B15|nr:hypothetical protein [Nostoc sp. FACHB-110]MBD2440360.1 hypothetical protein [Nostoc sp. FACHB-110]